MIGENALMNEWLLAGCQSASFMSSHERGTSNTIRPSSSRLSTIAIM